jgi:hypothetical protein
MSITIYFTAAANLGRVPIFNEEISIYQASASLELADFNRSPYLVLKKAAQARTSIAGGSRYLFLQAPMQ